MKEIAPNSCVFCEITKDKHYSRLDGLHPKGVWTWVEPCDRLRLERMRRNRMIREEITMTYGTLALVSPEQWLDSWVTYHGNTRNSALGKGQRFKVVSVKSDHSAVGFDAGIYGIQWAHPSALKRVEKPEDAAIDFLEPHKVTLSALDSEIKRLEDKLKELRAARQVISGL